MRCIVAAGCLALLLPGSDFGRVLSRRSMMSDPVFGITCDTHQVHFEYAPARVSRLCPDLQRKKFWLYAYWKEANTEYFVMSNRESETSGVGVVLRETQCVLGLPDWVLSGEPRFHPDKAAQSIIFSKTAVAGLVSDLFRRYSVAFGGKTNFLAVLGKDGLPPQDLLPSIRRGLDEWSRTP